MIWNNSMLKHYLLSRGLSERDRNQYNGGKTHHFT